MDWNTGKILQEVQCESHNMSGLAVGGGFIWAGSNGSVNGRRPPRPTDREYGEFSQLDMKTGKIVKVYRPAWGGGTHGLTYNPATCESCGCSVLLDNVHTVSTWTGIFCGCCFRPIVRSTSTTSTAVDCWRLSEYRSQSPMRMGWLSKMATFTIATPGSPNRALALRLVRSADLEWT